MARGLERSAAVGASILIRKNAYLVTLAVVSPRRNIRSQAQTSIFSLENQHFLVQMAPQASWSPDVPAEPGVLSQASPARIPQPGVLSQDSSGRSAQQRFLSQDSSARNLHPICLGSYAGVICSSWGVLRYLFCNSPNRACDVGSSWSC